MPLFTGETYAQSEPDIISAVAARLAKAGIDAIPLTQKNAWRAQLLGCDPRFR